MTNQFPGNRPETAEIGLAGLPLPSALNEARVQAIQRVKDGESIRDGKLYLFSMHVDCSQSQQQ